MHAFADTEELGDEENDVEEAMIGTALDDDDLDELDDALDEDGVAVAEPEDILSERKDEEDDDGEDDDDDDDDDLFEADAEDVDFDSFDDEDHL